MAINLDAFRKMMKKMPESGPLPFAKLRSSTKQPKRPSTTGVEASILNYMHDDNAHYAISLTGEKGAGKTWFCDNVLKPFLGKEGYSICRISLFGAANTNEISSKIAAGILFMDETSTNEFSKQTKRLLPEIAATAAKVFSDIEGIRISLDPIIMLSVLPRKKCLVVLDDLEGALFNDERILYGLLKELCEKQERKVLLVSNNHSQDHQENLLNNIVWGRYLYQPQITDLYDSIFSESISGIHSDLNIRNAVINGIKNSGTLNARSLIKARPSIIVIASSTAIRNTDIDRAEREHVLSRSIECAILIALGSFAEVKDTKPSAENNLTPYQREGYEYFQSALKPIEKGQCVDGEATSKALQRFMDDSHNRSPFDVKINNVIYRLQTLLQMDDSEADSIACELAEYIKTGNVKPHYMIEVYQANKQLRDLGFINALSDDEVADSFCKLIDLDPSTTRNALIGKRRLQLMFGNQNDPFIDNLIKKADNQAIIKAKKVIEQDKDCHDHALMIANQLRACANNNEWSLIPSIIAPHTIVAAFELGSGSSQAELIAFFKDECAQNPRPRYMNSEELRTWLDEIVQSLSTYEQTGILNNRRKELFIDLLNGILERI